MVIETASWQAAFVDIPLRPVLLVSRTQVGAAGAATQGDLRVLTRIVAEAEGI